MITATMVKDLREKTGAGMMDCKKALTETDGDMEKAIEYLREKGITKAAKKSDRIAAEGLVLAYISEDHKIGAAVEVNSETDFVAKNDEFRKCCQTENISAKREKASCNCFGRIWWNKWNCFNGRCN